MKFSIILISFAVSKKSYFYEKKHKNNIIPSSDEKLELQ